MSPRTFVTRGAALFALAALGLAACESKTVIPPPIPVAVGVTVTPASATLTAAGQTATFVALVTGGDQSTARTVTWKSSNTAVATVAATGNTAVVTAVGNGTTSIIATATADANAQAAAGVTVTIAAPPGPAAPPSVSIQSITNVPSGAPTELTNVSGSINIALNVDVPTGNTVSSVNWLIDGKTVCSQSFSAGKSANLTIQAANAVTMTCQINTAAATNGVPNFANGAHTFTATLVGPSGTTLVSTTQSLTFNNTNAVNLTASSTSTALAPTGFVWNGGNLTVTASPVIFSGAAVGRVVFTVFKVSDSSQVAQFTDSVAPFMVTFASDSTIALPSGSVFATTGGQINTALAGITDSLFVTATTVTTAGNQGPSQVSNMLRWDTQGPTFSTGPTAPASGWIGLVSTLKASTFGVTTTDNGGVNNVQLTFQARDTGTTTWNTITSTSQVGDKALLSEQFRVVACDALNNCTKSTISPALGVDIEAPTIQFLVPDNITPGSKLNASTYNAAKDSFEVAFSDVGPSGFATATPVQSMIVADTGAGANDTIMAKTATSSFILVPSTPASYMYYSGYVQDRAANKSNTVVDTVLVDLVAPSYLSTTPATALTGGTAMTFVDSATDNIAVGKASGKVRYTLSFGAFNKVLSSVTVASWSRGAAPVFNKKAAVNVVDPFFISALTNGITTTTATDLNGSITDVAGNATGYTFTFSGLSFPGTNPFANVTNTVVHSDTTAQTITAAYTIGGTSITTPVASQVLVFQVTGSGNATLVATGTSPVISVDPSNTHGTFTYSLTPTTTLTADNGTLIVAIFVTSKGIGYYTFQTLGQ